jgi:hypothetical protein
MKVLRNGNVTSVTELTFCNGWTVSMAVENRDTADVMIWNSAGETVNFPKWRSGSPDAALFGVSDDKLVLLLAYVQKLTSDTSVESVGQAFS